MSASMSANMRRTTLPLPWRGSVRVMAPHRARARMSDRWNCCHRHRSRQRAGLRENPAPLWRWPRPRCSRAQERRRARFSAFPVVWRKRTDAIFAQEIRVEFALWPADREPVRGQRIMGPAHVEGIRDEINVAPLFQLVRHARAHLFGQRGAVFRLCIQPSMRRTGIRCGRSGTRSHRRIARHQHDGFVGMREFAECRVEFVAERHTLQKIARAHRQARRGTDTPSPTSSHAARKRQQTDAATINNGASNSSPMM